MRITEYLTLTAGAIGLGAILAGCGGVPNSDSIDQKVKNAPKTEQITRPQPVTHQPQQEAPKPKPNQRGLSWFQENYSLGQHDKLKADIARNKRDWGKQELADAHYRLIQLHFHAEQKNISFEDRIREAERDIKKIEQGTKGESFEDHYRAIIHTTQGRIHAAKASIIARDARIQKKSRNQRAYQTSLDAAVESYKEAFRIDSTCGGYELLVQQLVNIRTDYNEALRIANEGLRHNPSSYVLNLYKGRALLGQGRDLERSKGDRHKIKQFYTQAKELFGGVVKNTENKRYEVAVEMNKKAKLSTRSVDRKLRKY